MLVVKEEKRLERQGRRAGAETYLSRRFRFFLVDLVKEFFEACFESLVFGALVEFAEEVAAGAEGVVAEGQGCIAEVLLKSPIASACGILKRERGMEWAGGGKQKKGGKKEGKGKGGDQKTYHAACVIAKGHAARVHHPGIRVTNAPDPVTGRLLPGCGHVT